MAFPVLSDYVLSVAYKIVLQEHFLCSVVQVLKGFLGIPFFGSLVDVDVIFKPRYLFDPVEKHEFLIPTAVRR